MVWKIVETFAFACTLVQPRRQRGLMQGEKE